MIHRSLPSGQIDSVVRYLYFRTFAGGAGRRLGGCGRNPGPASV